MTSKADFHTDDLLTCGFEKLYQAGVRNLFLDLDNTLESPFQKEPTERVKTIGERARSAGLNLAVVSNNSHPEKVQKFAQAVGARWWLCSARKPSSKRLKKLIEREGLNPGECALAGDQLLTDRPCALGANILFVLVEPVSRKDAVQTRLNRLLEKPFRRRWKKRNLLGEKI